MFLLQSYSIAVSIVLICNYFVNIHCNSIPVTTLNNENTERIHKQIENMKNLMNFKIDPCRNFFEYVCGNYYKNHNNLQMYPVLSSANFIEYALIKSPHQLDDNKSGLKLTEEELKATTFYESCKNLQNDHILNELANLSLNWPLKLENENEIDKIPNRTNFFDIVNVEKHEDTIIIYPYVSIYSTLFESDPIEYNQIYEIMLKRNLNADDAKKLTNELINMQEYLNTKWNDEHLNEIDTNSSDFSIVISLNELNDQFKNINWATYFERLFNNDYHNLTILLFDQVTTRQNLEIISETNQRILQNFLILKNINIIAKNKCASRTFKNFQIVLYARYMKLFINDNDKQSYIEDAQNFAASVKRVLGDDKSDAIVKETLKNIDILNSITSQDKIQRFYQNLIMNSDDYTNNLVQLAAINGNNDSDEDDDDDEVTQAKWFLRKLIPAHDKPRFSYFGYRYFDFWNSVLLKNQNVTLDNTKRQCRSEQLRKYHIISGYGDEVVQMNVRMKFTYEDYQRWIEKNSNETMLINNLLHEIDLDLNRVFFINFFQPFCGIEHNVRFVVNGGLANFAEFSNAFNCPIGSHMNPELKCVS